MENSELKHNLNYGNNEIGIQKSISIASQSGDLQGKHNMSTERTEDEPLHKIEITKGVPGKSVVVKRGRHGGAFNLSMQFNSGELMKFERHVHDYFCDGLNTSRESTTIRNASKDVPPTAKKWTFSNNAEDLVRLGSKEQASRNINPGKEFEDNLYNSFIAPGTFDISTVS